MSEEPQGGELGRAREDGSGCPHMAGLQLAFGGCKSYKFLAQVASALIFSNLDLDIKYKMVGRWFLSVWAKTGRQVI